jgi:hypothetical protein
MLTFKSTKMLTWMATFDRLLEAKNLIRITRDLPRGQFHERKFYAFPECRDWMKSEVPKMTTGRIQSAFTPYEQLMERLRQWLAGDPMRYGPWFHDMTPQSDCVWEMKTDDLRIFGWMYQPRAFIAVRAGFADHYKEPTKIKTYADERNEVVRARNALALDGQKFVEGEFDDLV